MSHSKQSSSTIMTLPHLRKKVKSIRWVRLKKLVNPLPRADCNHESLARHSYPYDNDGLTVGEQAVVDTVRNALNRTANHEPPKTRVPRDIRRGVSLGQTSDRRFAARCGEIDHELRVLELYQSEYGAQDWHTIPDHEVQAHHRFWIQTLRRMYFGKHMLTLKGIVNGKLDPADKQTLAECVAGKYKYNQRMKTVPDAEYIRLVSQRRLMAGEEQNKHVALLSTIAK